MLGLPPSTDLRKQIPKDAFFSSKNITGKDRASFDSEVHSMVIRSLISPESVNVPQGKNVKAIYVMEVQLNQPFLSPGNIKLLSKLGHKTVYVLAHSESSTLAVYEKVPFFSGSIKADEVRLSLSGLDLDQVWENIVRFIAPELSNELPFGDAVDEYIRIADINKKIEALEKKLAKAKQNHEQRSLFAQINELKKERDNPPDVRDWIFEKNFNQPLFPEEGVSVTRRVREICQPPGGYINPSLMKETIYDDGQELGEENIAPHIVGLAVDYLFRFMDGDSVEDAFQISILGAKRLGRYDEIKPILAAITGLDDESIANACRLCLFDGYIRAGKAPKTKLNDFQPDVQTCFNIRVFVNRTLEFFKTYGPVVDRAPTFFGGYTTTINRGDGDYITKDTFWDMKVSKNPINKDQTLQVAIYFLMGKHSMWPWFDTLRIIGIFNPRLNKSYVFDMKSLPDSVIKEIETDIIGYD